MDARDEGECNHRRGHNLIVSCRQSESTEEEQKAWIHTVVFCQVSDIGEKCIVRVDFVHPQDRLHKRSPIHFGARRKGGQIQPESSFARYRHDAGGNVWAQRTGYHRNDLRVERRGYAEDDGAAEAWQREGDGESREARVA